MKIKTLCIQTLTKTSVKHGIAKKDYKKHLYRACSEASRNLIDFEERKKGMTTTYCYTMTDPTDDEISNTIKNFKNIPFKHMLDCWVEW